MIDRTQADIRELYRLIERMGTRVTELEHQVDVLVEETGVDL